MQEITSVQNQLIKDVAALQHKKARSETGLFLIEGYKGVYEALKSNLVLNNIFISLDFNRSLQGFPEEMVYRVSDKVLKKISTTETPPEIVATAHKVKFSLEDLTKSENPLIIILENIKDPGNLGTIIRTARACNASGIILTDETVDIYNPKTVRATAANLWKIPVIYMSKKTEIKGTLNKLGHYQFVAATVAKDSGLYYEIDYKKPTVLMFGSEADGLSSELLEQADKLATIPMDEQVESLNLSISVGVILYEAVRQRLFGS